MPNWVCIDFFVTGEPAEIERFRERMIRTVRVPEDGFFGKAGEVVVAFDFNGVIPMPAVAAETDYENWAVENWGVKWNAQYLALLELSPNELAFQIDTAWDFPWPIFDALADEFPGLVFDGSAHEDGGAFAYAGQFNGADDFGPVEPSEDDEEPEGDDPDDAEEGDRP